MREGNIQFARGRVKELARVEAMRHCREPLNEDVLTMLGELEKILTVEAPVGEALVKAARAKIDAIALLVRAHDIGVATRAKKPPTSGVRCMSLSVSVDMESLAAGEVDAYIGAIGDEAKRQFVYELSKTRDELRKGQPG